MTRSKSLSLYRWALPLTDGVNDWDPLHCGMSERELHLVDEAQLGGYVLELISIVHRCGIANEASADALEFVVNF